MRLPNHKNFFLLLANYRKSMPIYIKDKKELANQEIKRILELLLLVWPPAHNVTNISNILGGYKNDVNESFHKVILHYQNNDLVGHAEVFQREIIINSKVIPILALAGVCVNPNSRGKKIGKEMVRIAFEFVDNGIFNLSIFQTNVPEFYFNLNCKTINNKFINSKNKTNVLTNPWRDPYVMLYPRNYEIGDEIIDLNGECY